VTGSCEVEKFGFVVFHDDVTPQVNFLRKITFDTLYTNEFVIGVCSRALAIPSERTTL